MVPLAVLPRLGATAPSAAPFWRFRIPAETSGHAMIRVAPRQDHLAGAEFGQAGVSVRVGREQTALLQDIVDSQVDPAGSRAGGDGEVGVAERGQAEMAALNHGGLVGGIGVENVGGGAAVPQRQQRRRAVAVHVAAGQRQRGETVAGVIHVEHAVGVNGEIGGRGVGEVVPNADHVAGRGRSGELAHLQDDGVGGAGAAGIAHVDIVARDAGLVDGSVDNELSARDRRVAGKRAAIDGCRDQHGRARARLDDAAGAADRRIDHDLGLVQGVASGHEDGGGSGAIDRGGRIEGERIRTQVDGVGEG